MAAPPGTEIQEVPIGDLDQRYRELRLPPERARKAALEAYLKSHGDHEPLLVTDGIDEGRLVLVDGFKRAGCLQEQGALETRVSVLHLAAPDALVAMAAANATRRGLTELEEGWILSRLHREHGLDQPRLAELFGRHKSWVSRRLSLVTRLERGVMDDVRIGLIPASTAREVARLPRGTQGAAVRAICSHALTAHETARLVNVLLAAAPEERRTILADPRASLARPAGPMTASSPGGGLSSAAKAIREELLRIHAAASRLEEVLLALAAGSLAAAEKELLGRLSGPVFAKTDSLEEKVKAALLAGPEVSHA